MNFHVVRCYDGRYMLMPLRSPLVHLRNINLHLSNSNSIHFRTSFNEDNLRHFNSSSNLAKVLHRVSSTAHRDSLAQAVPMAFPALQELLQALIKALVHRLRLLDMEWAMALRLGMASRQGHLLAISTRTSRCLLAHRDNR